MSNASLRPTRIACSLALIAGLAACGGPDLSGVRSGPQDVHPSPSELASVPLYDCGATGQAVCE